MTPDPFTHELRQADAGAGPMPPLPADLAARVQRRIERRRTVRRAVAVGVPVLAAGLVLAATAWIHERPAQAPPGPGRAVSGQAAVAGPIASTEQTKPAEEVRLIKLEAEQLRAEADRRQQIVDHLLRYEREQQHLDELRAKLARLDLLDQVEAHSVERAALVTLKDADALAEDPGRRSAALETYRRIVDLYPQTTWAGVARQRLSAAGG